MAAPVPEIAEILRQVESELAAMVLAGETGTVTVHCGRGDLSVEVTAKRKRDPVRIDTGRRMAVITKAR